MTGVTASIAFVLWANNVREPLVDLRLFRNATYAAANAATPTFGVAFAIMVFAFFFYMTEIWHYSLPRAGLAITPGPLLVVVTAILTGASALRSVGLGEQERDEVEAGIVDDASRLSRLIDKLLDLSRLQAGTAEPQPTWCAIDEVLREAVAHVETGTATFESAATHAASRSPTSGSRTATGLGRPSSPGPCRRSRRCTSGSPRPASARAAWRFPPPSTAR